MLSLVAEPPETQTGPDDELAGILLRAGRGDEAAWDQIVERYARRIFALAHSRCRDAEMAEEITQSVFVTLARKLGSDGYTERGRFESWLFRVAMNRLRDEIRRIRRHAIPTEPATFSAMPGAAARPAAESLDPLRRAMDSLGPADREVVELRHHGQLSFRQMADLTGEPLGTLLARHHRALRKLREFMERDGHAPTPLTETES